MPYVKKPAYEGFRAQLMSRGKPLLEKDVVPIQARLVAHLDTIRELLVQKSKRFNHKDCIVEITATWVGLDASPKAAIATLKRSWPGEAFGDAEEKFWIGEHDESVVLAFAAAFPEDRFLTGRILIVF